MRAGALRRLRVLSGPPMPGAQESILARDLADCVERCSTFVGTGDRGMMQVGLDQYLGSSQGRERGTAVGALASVAMDAQGLVERLCRLRVEAAARRQHHRRAGAALVELHGGES